MANIFSLYGSIFIDNEKANKSIDDTTKKGKETEKGFLENFGNVAKKGVEIGTAIVGTATAVIGGFTAMASKSGEYAGSILDASRKTDMTTKAMQELKYVGEQSGVSFDTITGSATKLNKAIASAYSGNKEAKKAFEDLGISITNSDGSLKTTTTLYNESISALADMDDRVLSTQAGMTLFGKGFADLKPMLEEGSAGIQGFKDQANELGLVLDDNAIQAGDTFSDTLGAIQTAFGGVFNSIMTTLMPVIQQVLDLILKNMPTIQAMISQFAPILVGLLQKILPVFINFVQTILPMLFSLLQILLPPLADIIEQLLPIFTQLIIILLPPLMDIIKSLLPALLPIIKALLPLITPILQLLITIINTVLLPILPILTSIANIISKVLVGALNVLIPVVRTVGNIFSSVFGGLFNIVKVPINFIIDGLNSFIRMVNQIKIPEWVPLVGGKGFSLPTIPKLRVGMDYVPYDEMQAVLHKGERVLTADENKEYSNNKNTKESIITNVINNVFNIEKVEVRDDRDIERISEELYYLQKKAVV